jgi:hypothetical protein
MEIEEKTTMSPTEPGLLPNFRVRCTAGKTASLDVAADSVSFTLAQRVSLQGRMQLWDTIGVNCRREDDGSLTVRVLLWDANVEDGLQIASLTSRPDDANPGQSSVKAELQHQVLK